MHTRQNNTHNNECAKYKTTNQEYITRIPTDEHMWRCGGGGCVCENIFKILFTKHHQDIVLDTKFMI